MMLTVYMVALLATGFFIFLVIAACSSTMAATLVISIVTNFLIMASYLADMFERGMDYVKEEVTTTPAVSAFKTGSPNKPLASPNFDTLDSPYSPMHRLYGLDFNKKLFSQNFSPRQPTRAGYAYQDPALMAEMEKNEQYAMHGVKLGY